MNSGRLTLAFIDRRPAAAAKALGEMAAETAAAFIEDIPTRYATRLLGDVSAWSSAAIVARMSADSAAAILRDLEVQDAAAVLRQLPSTLRTSLLEQLPAARRREFEVALSYPNDTVGAHMTTSIVALDGSATSAETREQLLRAPQVQADRVFVTDSTSRLVGSVKAATLLRASQETTLGDLMTEDPAAVPVNARLAKVIDLEAWNEYALLPVVDRRHRLIGAISRQRARAVRDGERAEPQTRSGFIVLASAFAACVVELGRLISD